jgi:hypothetical protein
VPQTANTKIANFADDTDVIAVGENTDEATDKLQLAGSSEHGKVFRNAAKCQAAMERACEKGNRRT